MASQQCDNIRLRHDCPKPKTRYSNILVYSERQKEQTRRSRTKVAYQNALTTSSFWSQADVGMYSTVSTSTPSSVSATSSMSSCSSSNSGQPLGPALSSIPAVPSFCSGDLLISDDIDSGRLSPEDLHLLSHWCTTTYRSLSRNCNEERVWKCIVPKESMRQSSLRHGILALSALQLAFTSGTNVSWREWYLKTAQMHQKLAISGLASDLRNLRQSNSQNMTALSNIMVTYSFASLLLEGSVLDFSRPLTPSSPPDHSPALSPLEKLCHVFELITSSIHLQIGKIQLAEDDGMVDLPVMQESSGPPKSKMPNTSTLAIQTLRRINAALATSRTGSPCRQASDINTYNKTIDQLGICLGMLASGSEPMIMVFRWIFSIPEHYLDLLQERQPLALAILAHYCVIMHQLRGRWWMGEWGMSVLKEICLLLGRDGLQSISWAIDATGICVPGPLT